MSAIDLVSARSELADRMRVILRKAVGVDVDARPGPPFYILGPMDLDELADRIAILLVVEASISPEERERALAGIPAHARTCPAWVAHANECNCGRRGGQP